MRIRTIKPEFWKSESVGRLSRDAKLLFIGLWNLADDEGRLRGSARLIRGELFAYEDPATVNVVEWLRELVLERMVEVYVVDRNTYVAITGWKQHQRVNRPSKSRLPAPPEVPTASLETIAEDQLGPTRPPVNHPTLPGFPEPEPKLAVLPQPAPELPPAPAPAPEPPPAPAPAPTPSRLTIQRKPASVEEVVEAGRMVGVAEQDARDWWRDCEACGWSRGDGSPFANWRRELVIHRDRLAERRARATPRPATNGNGNGHAPATPNGAQIVAWTKELDVVNARIKSIRDSYDAHVDFAEWSDIDRAALKKLKERAALLKRSLGMEF